MGEMIVMEPIGMGMIPEDDMDEGMPSEIENMMRLTEAMMAPPPGMFGGRV
mgnify:CR=1 FL=1